MVQASAVKAKKSTYESVNAQQDEVDGDDHRSFDVDYSSRDWVVVDEVDGDDHRSLDVDYSSRDWVVVEEEERKKSLLVRRIPKRIPRYRHIATVNIRALL